MTQSIRFNELKNGIENLKADLLPSNFTDVFEYTREEITKTIAFRVLAHAEIESYLEDRAEEIALNAIKQWKNNGIVNRTLISLLAFSDIKMDKPPDKIRPIQQSQVSVWDDKVQLNNKIESAVSNFFYAINKNNGIKEENIMRLLLPIGIDCNEFDQVLINDLNSFGTKRGQAAHKRSLDYRTTEQIDPKEELFKVESILTNLTNLEDLFNSVC